MSGWSHTSLFYVYTVLWRLQFTNALWILYLLHLGWPLWQVGVAEAAFHAVALATEIPTGAFADRFGSRASLTAGLLVGALTSLGMFALPPLGIVPGVLAIGATALAWSFTGGADRALLYRIASESPAGSASYAHLYGRTLAITLAAGAGASAAGGLLAGLGWVWPFALSAVPLGLAIIPLSYLPAPKRQPDEVQPPLLSVMRQGGRAVGASRGLLLLVAFGALLALLVTTNGLYAQSTLSLKGAPVALVTILIGAFNAIGAVGSLLGAPVRRFMGTLLPAGALVIAGALAFLGVSPLVPAAVALGTISLADGIISPVYDAAMNDLAPPAVRATVLSYENALFSLSMMIFFPLFGWAVGRFGMTLPYAVLAVGGIGLAVLALGVGRAEAPRRAAERQASAGKI